MTLRPPALGRGAVTDSLSLSEVVGRIGGTDPMTDSFMHQCLSSCRGCCDASGCLQSSQNFTSINRHFEVQATRTPDALALATEASSITFRELNARADHLASLLRWRGVGPESRAAIILPRSIDAVVSVLACLKVGAAYVPIGVTSPLRLIDDILDDARCQIILCHREARWSDRMEALPVDEVRFGGDDQGHASPEWPGDALAWILYTSGSSGQPKGVRGTHRGVLQRCEALWALQPFASGERAIQNTSLTVVDSPWELWGPLCQGVPVLLLDDQASQDLPRYVGALNAHRITRICLVPSLLHALLTNIHDLQQRLPHLRLWVVSGELLNVDLVRQFYAQLPEAVLLNQYGLTETSADITSFDTRSIASAPSDLIHAPIGVPFPGVHTFILDERLEPAHDGEEGELYVSGDCVADGYLRRPELTAERFLPNPFAVGSPVMLRTGDRARRLSTGDILITGRADRQVKVRGHRVELDGVEAMVCRHPGVGSAAVIYRTTPLGNPQLIAYFCKKLDGDAPTEAGLREFCANHALAHMIPHRFVELDEMPRTQSGKIDRKALGSSAGGEVPIIDRPDLSAVEDEVRRIWCRLLALPDIGVDESFFHSGGDSLLLMKLLKQLGDQFGRNIPMKQLASNPTIAFTCELIQGEEDSSAGPEALTWYNEAMQPAGADSVPLHQVSLSQSQTSIWIHEQMASDGNPYGITSAATLRGVLDIARLKGAFQSIVQAQPILSTRLVMDATGLQQRTVADDASFFEVIDGRRISDDNKHHFVADQVRLVSSRRLDLEREAPILVRVVLTAEDEAVLILQVHHLVCDGRSIGVLLDMIAEAYDVEIAGGQSQSPDYRFLAYCNRERILLPPPIRPTREASPTIQAENAAARIMAHWEEAISDLAFTPALPFDHPSGKQPSFAGREIIIEVERQLVDDQLQRIGKNGITPFQLFFAAYAMALFRAFSYESQTIGFTHSLRPNRFDDALGCYVTLLPCFLHVTKDTTRLDLLAQVSDSLWSALQNGGIPFEAVLNHLRVNKRLSDFQGFQTVVSLDNRAVENLRLFGLDIEPRPVEKSGAQFPLSLNIETTRSGYRFLFEYQIKLFEEKTIAALGRDFLGELKSFADAV
ncbi:amino acid adenylation domain-containing protein [Rhizobium leguminosarum bv. viciae]|nr:amino acid adenylation domain-containing protein [Rhizobium leguminosarum bv. viciae]